MPHSDTNAKTAAKPGLLHLIRSDAARWVVEGQFHDPATISLGRIFSLYYQYMGFRAAVWYRIGNWCHRRRIRGVPKLIQLRIHRKYGLEIAMRTPVGEGLYIAHTVGMVLAPKSIGRNCSFIASVTVGMRNKWEFPVIGDNVFVGAGARILGGIRIGEGVVVGANAVVIHDVAPGETVVGIPAKPIRRNEAAAGDAAPEPGSVASAL